MSSDSPLELWQDYLEAALPNNGKDPLIVRVYRETQSTQDIAKSFAPARALVIADHQRSGRGRLGRSWVSRPGASVLMSVCWPVDHFGRTHDQFSLLAGVALARAVERISPGADIRLKWPNDVHVEQRKLAGILVERIKGAVIIGIGLNVTTQACPDPELRPSAISLQELGKTVNRLEVIETIYVELDRVLGSMNLNRTLMQWRAYAPLGNRHTFQHNHRKITGTVLDLDPHHGLIVRRDSGEIVMLPAATTSVVK